MRRRRWQCYSSTSDGNADYCGLTRVGADSARWDSGHDQHYGDVQQYDVTFDRAGQEKIIRRIDGLIFRTYPYALGWTAGFTRILYYDKFGHPAAYFSRISDYSDIPSLWWLDPKKEKALDEAIKDGTKLPVGETEQRPWKK